MFQIQRPFAFDFTTNEWTHIANQHATRTFNSSKVKIATFNILQSEYSFVRNCLLRPLTRFQSTISMITNPNDRDYLNADIICLNEVDSTFLALLMKDPIVQQHFYLSEIVSTQFSKPKYPNRSITTMGNLLVSRIPFEACYSVALPDTCDRNITIGVFLNQSLVIASVHPTAYQHYADRRATQLEFIFDHLNFSNTKELFLHSSVFVVGDTNLHLSEENEILKEKNIIDLYHETVIVPFMKKQAKQIEYPPKDEQVENYPYGFTWNLFPLDNRKMRLDRILRRSNLKQNTKMKEWIPCGPVDIFAKEKIANSYYLRRSDHFGLALEIEWKEVEEPMTPNKEFPISCVTLPCERLSKFF